MSINDLPNECLHIIFRNISLQDQFLLRQVSTRWCAQIEYICQNRRSLKLFGSFESFTDFCDNLVRNNHLFEGCDQLKLRKIPYDDDLIIRAVDFNAEQCKFLIRLFPNIEQLVVNFTLNESFTFLTHLLEQWSDMSTLSLCGLFNSDEQKFPPGLFETINKRSSIRCLDLLVRDIKYDARKLSVARPTKIRKVLQRLEHFSLSMYDGKIVPALNKLGSNCRHLHLEYINFDSKEFGKLLKDNCEFAHNVTHLHIGGLFDDRIQFLDLVCTHFVSLQYLCVKFRVATSLFEVIQCASKLGQLTKLQLEQTFWEDKFDIEQIRPLSKVKTLIMNSLWSWVPDLDGELMCEDIDTLFPNVEHIRIDGQIKAHLNPDMMSEYLAAFSHSVQFRVFDYIAGSDYKMEIRLRCNERKIARRCKNTINTNTNKRIRLD